MSNGMINALYFDYAANLLCLYLDLANRHFCCTFPQPTLSFKKKGSVAGTAHLSTNHIQINQELTLHYQFPFLDEVIPHELAHLIAYQRFGRHIKPHGKEWKMVMQSIFLMTPKRTHSFLPPQATPKKRFRYRCACQTHELSIIRHRRIQEKGITYFCTHCKQSLCYEHATKTVVT